jgi:hypothetical protein
MWYLVQNSRKAKGHKNKYNKTNIKTFVLLGCIIFFFNSCTKKIDEKDLDWNVKFKSLNISNYKYYECIDNDYLIDFSTKKYYIIKVNGITKTDTLCDNANIISGDGIEYMDYHYKKFSKPSNNIFAVFEDNYYEIPIKKELKFSNVFFKRNAILYRGGDQTFSLKFNYKNKEYFYDFSNEYNWISDIIPFYDEKILLIYRYNSERNSYKLGLLDLKKLIE